MMELRAEWGRSGEGRVRAHKLRGVVLRSSLTFMISPLMKGSSAAASYFSSGSLNDAPDTTPDSARGAAPGAPCTRAFNAVVNSGEDIEIETEVQRLNTVKLEPESSRLRRVA